MERSDDEMIEITAESGSFQDLCPDVLVRIFMYLNVVNLMVVSTVCQSWKQASRDPKLWHKVDLTKLNIPGFEVPKELDAWSGRASQARMARFLKYVLDMGNFNTKCLIFNCYIHLSDELLTIAAERTPNLTRLVLASSGRLTKRGIEKAMASWKMLESITITSIIKDHSILFGAIGKFCNHIVELKFCCSFEEEHVDGMITNTPNIRAFSLRNNLVNQNALYRALDSLQHLKVVNVSHSLFWNGVVAYSASDRLETPMEIEEFLRNNVKIRSWKGKLITCFGNGCSICNPRVIVTNKKDDDGPFAQLEKLWGEDEIPSLAN